MNVRIQVNRIKELHARSGKSQEQLARQAKIHRRHFQRIEQCQEDTYSVRENTLEKLARALKVAPEVLTGEHDMPPSDGKAARSDGSRVVRQTTIRLDTQSTLNYDLIERRYGVNLQEVVNIAPLLFVIHAEQSLRRRKRLNKSRLESVEQIMELSEAFPKLKSLIGYPDSDYWFEDSDQHLSELGSIDNNDIFAERIYNETPGDGGANPFVAHLDAVLAEMDSPLLARISRFEDLPFDAVMYFPGNRVPDHEVCRSDLLEITGSDFLALMALKSGAVRIRDIPEELMADDKLVERVTWLRAAGQHASAKQISGDTSDQENPKAGPGLEDVPHD